MAARRVGIKRVILPEENQKDLTELPEPVQKEMEFIFAKKIEDVLTAASPQLGSSLVPEGRPRTAADGAVDAHR